MKLTASTLSFPLSLFLCAIILIWQQVPEDTDLTPPILSAPNGKELDNSKRKQNNNEASGGAVSAMSSGNENAGNQGHEGNDKVSAKSGTAKEQKEQPQLKNEFTCKDHDGNEVAWFVAIKEYKTYRYVFSTSNSQNFEVKDDITIRGPVYNTLVQTRNSRQAVLFYSYSSYDSSPTQGHQNGVLLFGKKKGFWLIHSWRRLFEYFSRNNFSYQQEIMNRTKSQSFICITHNTATDLEKIRQQLFITNPKGTHGSLGLNANAAPDRNRAKAEFTIGPGYKLVHYSQLQSTEDIYSWIATDNQINGSYGLIVQSWQPIGNAALHIKDIGDHGYSDLSVNESVNQVYSDHSKWCVPVRNGSGSYKENLTFVCIGDLNRGQINRPGGAMCLFHSRVWEYFKDIAINSNGGEFFLTN